MKPASKERNASLDKFLNNLGFTRSTADRTLYLLKKGIDFVFDIVYVDDILILSNSQSVVDEIVRTFQASYAIMVSDRIERFLGMSIIDGGNEVHFHNEPMIERDAKVLQDGKLQALLHSTSIMVRSLHGWLG